MTLPDKSIEEFKEIWKKEYGTEITDAEARHYGEDLVGFFKILIDIDKNNK